ncbi:hypothetical protein N3K66_009066 [Trichothecium roseum]|uniref:Uncharacterized protein n=1 Tax=Trichothecium roseum TaxID=47278 RepID=A0ACC0URX7_9HYPO|nr:hypothetical protein N3K66_009066 [Trichothecium roseum]
MLAHYLSGQHDSDPGDVFRTLYRDICHRAYKASPDTSETFDEFFLPAGFVALLEHSVCQQFGRYLEVGATDAHRSLLVEARDYISHLASEATCLSCLASRPQYALPCVHTICQACIWRFGNISDSRSCYLSNCPLCDTQAELIVLEETIGLPCPIQYLFDVVVGTSSGSIIASALCITFRSQLLLRGPLSSLLLPSNWWAFMNSLLFDGRYPATNLKSTLKGVFGSERSILDPSSATERGVMVGMPIATSNSDTIIATNYNRVGCRNGNQDYTILRSDNKVRQIPLWELYLKPHYISGVG